MILPKQEEEPDVAPIYASNGVRIMTSEEREAIEKANFNIDKMIEDANKIWYIRAFNKYHELKPAPINDDDDGKEMIAMYNYASKELLAKCLQEENPTPISLIKQCFTLVDENGEEYKEHWLFFEPK